MPATFRVVLGAALLTFPTFPTWAQPAPQNEAQVDASAAISPDETLSPPPARVLDLDVELAKGRELLESRDPRAMDVLRRAAQNAAAQLAAAGGQELLLAPPEQMPRTGYEGQLARQTAQAHYLWGAACDTFGRRDEAITALARAIRFAGPERSSGLTGRDARLRLSAALNLGLPLVAPDDVLGTVSVLASQSPETAWKPFVKRVSLPDAAGRRAVAAEFLITSGSVLPPALPSRANALAGYTRVPPLYRNVSDDKLPPALKLDKVVFGFERLTSGSNKGQWRQLVQVFYASPLIASDGRDDRPRAEALAQAFLKAQALYRDALKLSNPYARDGVTKIYLSEYSALWPDDEDDPVVRAAMGVKMPAPNTGLRTNQKVVPTVKLSPLSRVWRPVAARNGATIGAAQMDVAPGEIIFFKLTRSRPESEWLREMAHEIGHVVVPAFGPYAPPNEPYANGTLGETLSTLWIASQPNAFSSSVPPTTKADALQNVVNVEKQRANLPLEASVLRVQVGDAVSALRFWQNRGPLSPLSRSGSTDGWRYLQGLGVYLERVYGPEFAGATLRRVTPSTKKPVFAIDWLNALSSAEASRGQSIWLPGALDGLVSRGDDLVNRAPMRLSGARLGAWLWVPPSSKILRVEWRGTGNVRTQGFPSAPAVARGALSDAIPGVLPPSAEPRGDRALLINVSGRGGWRRFTFLPSGDVTLSSARFE